MQESKVTKILIEVSFRICRYATSPILNSFSSLIQDFYNLEAVPLPAVHLTLDPVTLTFKTFVSSPIGLSTLQTLNLLFKPIPCSLSIPTPERTTMELLTKPILDSTAANQNIQADLKNQQQKIMAQLKEPLKTDLPMHHLHQLLTKLKNMLDQVYEYVEKVNKGEVKGNNQVGRLLLDTIGSLPLGLLRSQTGSASKGGDVHSQFEDDFQSHIAVSSSSYYFKNLEGRPVVDANFLSFPLFSSLFLTRMY
jgi:translation initiation factor 3 subunit F